MIVAHLPACFSAAAANEGGDFDALRGLLLAASQVLFLLKLADVRWLRLPRRGRALLAVAVAVVLLHGDVVRRYVTAEAAQDAPSAALVFAGGITLLVGCDVAARRLPRLIRLRRAHSAQRANLARTLESLVRLPVRRPATILVQTMRIGRAPPN